MTRPSSLLPSLHLPHAAVPARSAWPWRLRAWCLAAAGLALLGGCGQQQEEPARARTDGSYDADGARLHGTPEAASRPNVIVLVIDTLRADAVTGRDGRPGRMPYLASLGARGTTFRAAVAPASWTLPSLTSLLTGLAPHAHRCVELGAGVSVPKEVTTFAEALGAGHGYETRAYVGLAPQAAAASLFDGFSHVTPEFSLQAVGQQVVPWARERDPRRPFLLLLHTYDAHEPYGRANQLWPKPKQAAAFAAGDPLAGEPPAPWDVVRRCLLDWKTCWSLKSVRHRTLQDQYLRSLWSGLEGDPQPALLEELHAAYETGAAWVDELLRTAMEQLEAAGLLRDTLVVVTSDHGESFGEHGILLHGRQLYEELIHIPLVIAPFATARGGPFAAAHVVEDCVGLVDVFPTLLASLGLAPVGGRQGRSFLEVVKGQGEARPVISEVRVTPETTGGAGDQQVMSARSRSWKYILTCDFGKGLVREVLFDLRVDPAERSPVPLASVDGGTVGAAFARAVEEVRDHFWRGPAAPSVSCDLPGTPAARVTVPRPRPLVAVAPEPSPAMR